MSARIRGSGGLSLNYENVIVGTLWDYRGLHFCKRDEIFDRNQISKTRPPVFLPRHAGENLLYNPSATSEERKELELLLPLSKRHRWFRSMKSSQALAQSVLGNLYLSKRLHCLDSLKGDDGQPLFATKTGQNERSCWFEEPVRHLGEDPKRCT